MFHHQNVSYKNNPHKLNNIDNNKNIHTDININSSLSDININNINNSTYKNINMNPNINTNINTSNIINNINNTNNNINYNSKMNNDPKDNDNEYTPTHHNTAILSDQYESIINLHNLTDTRVIQKNLVYVIGIPTKYGRVETLISEEFFGKFGKIKKLVVKGHNEGIKQTYNSTLNTVSCYITYYSPHDAQSCISILDESLFDNKVIKCTYGTTKYCSYFLKNRECINEECMYLHFIDQNDQIMIKSEINKNKSNKLHNFRILNKGKMVLGKKKVLIDNLVKYKINKVFRKPERLDYSPF